MQQSIKPLTIKEAGVNYLTSRFGVLMKIVDLFSGCGGMSKGFEQAGHDVVMALDSWKAAVDTYNKNFTHQSEIFDLSDVNKTLKKIRTVPFDAIIGGPPCQDFSSAGIRKEGDRANLTAVFAKIIARALPPYFVMENVARTRTSSAYAVARDIFSTAGYGLTEIILDASKCGVPQLRKRFFCIGSLHDGDSFLEERLLSGLSEKQMTVREYFKSELPFENYYRHPRNYNRRAVFSVDEPAATIRGVNRPIPAGYTGHSNDSVALNKELRALTTHERARIQTFPKNFKWIGNKTEIEQMIGNAVPVNLAKYIANALADHVKSACDKEAA